MNARSRFSPSAIPNGHTTCGSTKKAVVREKEKKKKECFSRIESSWQSSICNTGPCLKVWYCRLHSEIMDLHMPVYRSSPCLKWCPTLRGLHSSGERKHCQMIFSVISGNRLLVRYRPRWRICCAVQWFFFLLWSTSGRLFNTPPHPHILTESTSSHILTGYTSLHIHTHYSSHRHTPHWQMDNFQMDLSVHFIYTIGYFSQNLQRT